MTVKGLSVCALLGALAMLPNFDGSAFAQEPGGSATPGEVQKPAMPAPSPAPAPPNHGAGASGKGDGSGMGQDTSEIGTPKGPGDKGGPPSDKTVAPKVCDDGRQPIDGACPG